MTKRLLIPLALTASIAAAGCGSSSSSNSSGGSGSGSGSSGSSTPAAKPTASGGGASIEMKNIAFNPKNVTVKVGQKVTWTNEDSVDHNVIAGNGAFKSKDFGQNETFSYTPTKAGTIQYQCTLHPGMTATLTVTG